MQYFSVISAGLMVIPAALSAAECTPATIHFSESGPAEFTVPDADEAALRQREHGAAPGADHVLVIHDGDGYWVPTSELNAVQVVLGTGADSFVYEGPDHCAPKDLPLDMELSQPEAAKAPLASGLQPRSGLWKLEASPVTFEGCPEMIAQSLPANMVALPAEATTPQRLTFGDPFHPDQLAMNQYASGWKATGPGRWETRAMEHVFAQSPTYNGRQSYLQWSLTVRGEEQISHRSELYVVIPPQAIAVFKTDHCAAISTGNWIRVGD